jgi:hypothetical protein
MHILFADARLQTKVQSRVTESDRSGVTDHDLVHQRLCELVAADSLAIAATVPTLDVSKLDSTGDEFTVRIRAGLRLRFQAANGLSDGESLDPSQITAIRILAIEEAQ